MDIPQLYDRLLACEVKLTEGIVVFEAPWICIILRDLGVVYETPGFFVMM